MKIELKMNGKNFFDPVFIFMYNDERDNFVLGIRYTADYDYSFIREDLIENFENFEIKGTSFMYSTKDNIYVFNLSENFNLLPKSIFKHGVVLLDKDDKIISESYLKLMTNLNENNNK